MYSYHSYNIFQNLCITSEIVEAEANKIPGTTSFKKNYLNSRNPRIK